MTEIAKVNCGTCRHCCKGELILLYPAHGDDPAQYLTRTATNPLTNQPQLALQQKDNGDCIYLGDGGCTIWGKHPAICKTFDCVKNVMSMKATLPNKQEYRLYKKLFGGEVFDIGERKAKEMGLG